MPPPEGIDFRVVSPDEAARHVDALTANVGGVEFTTRTIAAQGAPGVSGRSVVASIPDGLPAPTT